MEEKITMKEQIKILHARMICKADLIYDYMKKGMDEYARVELWSLQEMMQKELDTIIKYIPGNDKVIIDTKNESK